MPSPIDPVQLSSATFAAAVMRRILSEPNPTETGADRFKQIGLMMIIHNLQLRGVDPTTSAIEEVANSDRRAIYDTTAALEAKGLLQKLSVTNRHNKGRVFKFVIPEGVFDPLAI
jgi:hypothetical protein